MDDNFNRDFGVPERLWSSKPPPSKTALEQVTHPEAVAPVRDEKPMRAYRSEAERIALKQRNVQIGLSLVILLISTLGLLAQTLDW